MFINNFTPPPRVKGRCISVKYCVWRAISEFSKIEGRGFKKRFQRRCCWCYVGLWLQVTERPAIIKCRAVADPQPSEKVLSAASACECALASAGSTAKDWTWKSRSPVMEKHLKLSESPARALKLRIYKGTGVWTQAVSLGLTYWNSGQLDWSAAQKSAF